MIVPIESVRDVIFIVVGNRYSDQSSYPGRKDEKV